MPDTRKQKQFVLSLTSVPMSFVDIFKTCPPIMFLCSPYDGIYWPQDLYAGICEGKYLPLTHFMPGPGLIVNTLSAGFFIHPWGKGGEEKIENSD